MRRFLLFLLLLCCCCWFDVSMCYTWNNVKIIAGGFVDGILFHPTQKDLYYARTDIGGPYRFDPTTRMWVPLTDFFGPDSYFNMGVECIAIDPTEPNRLYAAVGMYIESWAPTGAFLRSEDQGRTWKQTDLTIKLGGNDDGRFAGQRVAVDPNFNSTLFFGSRQDGLWHSDDYGVTWSKVTTFPITGPTNGIGVVFVLFDASSGQAGSPTPVVYAGVSQTSGGLYRSTDGGQTWSLVSGQPTSYLPNMGVMTSSSIYITYGNAPGPNSMTAGSVHRYDTGTGAWTDVTPLKTSTGFGYAGLAVNASNPMVVMVSTMDRWYPGDTIFRSTDGGSTWHDVGPLSTRDPSVSPWITFGEATAQLGWWIGALAIDPFRTGHVLYGTGATIWESYDADLSDSGEATHWTVGADGIEETAVLDLLSPTQGAPLLSGVGDICGFRHDVLTKSPPKGMYLDPIMSNVDSLDFVVSSPLTVVRVGRGDPKGINGALSSDGGTTWTPFASAPNGDGNTNTIAASPDGTTLVWTHGTSALPYYSTDLTGSNWTVAKGAPIGTHVVSDRVSSAHFYGFASSGTVYVSKDGGRTYVATAQGLPTGSGHLRAVPGVAGEVWLNVGNSWDSSAGLYRSRDYGVSFQRVTTVGYVAALGFGKAPPGKSFPAVYIQGRITTAGVTINALYRSDDEGATWVRINDDLHQYGGAVVITGDPNRYGRVYVGTNGRGIFYGDI